MIIEGPDGKDRNTHRGMDEDAPKEYIVRWEVEVSATSPEQAAHAAAAMARDPGTTATFFDVLDPSDESLIEQFDVPHTGAL